MNYMHACMCACVRACVCVCVCTHLQLLTDGAKVHGMLDDLVVVRYNLRAN